MTKNQPAFHIAAQIGFDRKQRANVAAGAWGDEFRRMRADVRAFVFEGRRPVPANRPDGVFAPGIGPLLVIEPTTVMQDRPVNCAILGILSSVVPACCWGNPERVKAWLALDQTERAEQLAKIGFTPALFDRNA